MERGGQRGWAGKGSLSPATAPGQASHSFRTEIPVVLLILSLGRVFIPCFLSWHRAVSALQGPEHHSQHCSPGRAGMPLGELGMSKSHLSAGHNTHGGLAARPWCPKRPCSFPHTPFPFPLSPGLFIWPSKLAAAATGSGSPKLPLGKKFWHPAAESGDSGKLFRACLISGLDISLLSISLPKEI